MWWSAIDEWYIDVSLHSMLKWWSISDDTGLWEKPPNHAIGYKTWIGPSHDSGLTMKQSRCCQLGFELGERLSWKSRQHRWQRNLITDRNQAAISNHKETIDLENCVLKISSSIREGLVSLQRYSKKKLAAEGRRCEAYMEVWWNHGKPDRTEII